MKSADIPKSNTAPFSATVSDMEENRDIAPQGSHLQKSRSEGQQRQHIVKRAQVLGYCMGVRRAVDAVYRALADYPDKTVYTYGPLIHNPVTMRLLEAKGVHIVNPDEELKPQIIPQSPIIIRAHGISPQKRQELIDCGAIIIDATCPKVIASQFKAAQYSQKGYTVILAGNKNHGELIGIRGHVLSVPNGKCITVQTAAEAKTLQDDGAPTVLIAQTTIKRDEYRAIADILHKKIAHLTVLETICSATDERQEALLELVKEVDAILVIGGSNSYKLPSIAVNRHGLPKPPQIFHRRFAAIILSDLPPVLQPQTAVLTQSKRY